MREEILQGREYFRRNLYDKYASAKKEPKRGSDRADAEPQRRRRVSAALQGAKGEARKKALMQKSKMPGRMMDSAAFLKSKMAKIRALEQRLFEENCTFKPSIRKVPKFVAERWELKGGKEG